ncbi:MAG: hypothetical protein HY303_11345 [Candidatus Wallbacteria bacterium]|nr:hypothetical protein [Candidatus Wallbacteria bacterium]
MADPKGPKNDAGKEPSMPGARKPGTVAAPRLSEVEPSGASSSGRARVRKPTADPSGPGLARQGGKMLRPGMGTTPQPDARRRRGVWFAATALALLAGAGGGAYWYTQVRPADGTSFVEPSPAPPPQPLTVPAPEIYLPEPGKDKSLPRSYQAESLVTAEDALRRAHVLRPTPPEEPWCDAFRILKDPQLDAIGYDFHSKTISELVVRYRADKPVDESRAVQAAAKLYGPASGTYTYRTRKSHTVTFWEDSRTLLKLDAEGDGSERRLSSLHLVDKAASVERAAARKP